MDHIRFNVKNWQNDKSEVVVGCNKDLLAGVSSVLCNCTFSVYTRRAHGRPDEVGLI